ncbi:MAG: hypothetical protein V3R98_09375 [Alphaproteobacteria bacterium]
MVHRKAVQPGGATGAQTASRTDMVSTDSTVDTRITADVRST